MGDLWHQTGWSHLHSSRVVVRVALVWCMSVFRCFCVVCCSSSFDVFSSVWNWQWRVFLANALLLGWELYLSFAKVLWLGSRFCGGRRDMYTIQFVMCSMLCLFCDVRCWRLSPRSMVSCCSL